MAGAILSGNLSIWFGFFFSLLIFSAVAGDNFLSRLGQHILVGAALGYAVILAGQHVLQPRLVVPLLQGTAPTLTLWVALGLGTLLLIAGLDRIVAQGRFDETEMARWRRILQSAGRLPAAVLLGTGLGAALMGILQGTFVPQYWRAAQLAFDASVPPGQFVAGIFMLLLTTATLLYLYVEPQRFLAKQSIFVRRVISGWIWVGQRAFWVAAGLVFARLAAARLSLLIGRFQYLIAVVVDSDIWR